MPEPKALAAAKKAATLGGELTVETHEIDGEEHELISQVDYGLWPVCQICNRTKSKIDSQIEPSEWSNHSESHIS